jgi:hypothetical protein
MGEEKSSGFWGTLPGVLTGIAAVVTAVGGIVLGLHAGQSDGTNDSKVGSTTSTAAFAGTTSGADAIAGKWSGTARRQDGSTFTLFLEVKKPCDLNDQCGTISVSDVPCYGQVFLHNIDGNHFEFEVANFYGKSNPDKCTRGAGEVFTPGPDDTLLYTASYEGPTSATLTRVGN